MRQNGHVAEFTGRYDQTRADYDRTPVKPVLDGEPIYEDHPVSFDAKKLGPLDRRRRAPAALLGPVQRRLRPHLRPPLRLADVGAGPQPDQQPAHAVVRGHRPARRRPDAARPPAARVAAVPHARPGRLDHRHRPRADLACRARADIASWPRATRTGSYAMVYAPGRADVQGAHGRDHGPEGQGLVVQPAQRPGHRHRRVRQHGRARVHAARSRARCSTGCSCSTTRPGGTRPPGRAPLPARAAR